MLDSLEIDHDVCLHARHLPHRQRCFSRCSSTVSQVAAMRGGEDLSSRRRRSSSRGSFSSSLSIQPVVLGSSNVATSRPSATGASTAHASATVAELRCSNDEPPSGLAVQRTQPRPADLRESTVRSNESPAADESGYSSDSEHGSNGAAHCGPDPLSRPVPVAWQPGIDLLEGMQESKAQDSPTETRRLSDSAATGPRSYPLSPRSLAAVSPGPPVQQREGGIAARVPAESLPLAGAARASLPAPAQVSASANHPSTLMKLGGWALPPRAPHAAAGISADAQRDSNSKVGAGSIAARPLEKQLSSVDAATQLLDPGNESGVQPFHEHQVVSRASASVQARALTDCYVVVNSRHCSLRFLRPRGRGSAAAAASEGVTGRVSTASRGVHGIASYSGLRNTDARRLARP